MPVSALRMYFKASVLVPFYLAFFIEALCLTVAASRSGFSNMSQNPLILYSLNITLFSGITGLLALTIFLNQYPFIANHPIYRLLAWMLLPGGYIIYFFCRHLPHPSDKIVDILNIYSTIICFLHFIGLIIGFLDFRASMILSQNEKKINEKGRLN